VSLCTTAVTRCPGRSRRSCMLKDTIKGTSWIIFVHQALNKHVPGVLIRRSVVKFIFLYNMEGGGEWNVLTKYYTDDQTNNNHICGACVTYGAHDRCVTILVWKSEGKRPLWRPRRRFEDITIELREIDLEGVVWIDLAQEREEWRCPATTVGNLQVPYSAGNFLASWRAKLFKKDCSM